MLMPGCISRKCLKSSGTPPLQAKPCSSGISPPREGDESRMPAPHLFGHYTPNTAAAVIFWFCQKIVVNLPGCGGGSRLFFELPKILVYRLAAHAVATRYLPDAHPFAAMRQNDGCLFLHV